MEENVRRSGAMINVSLALDFYSQSGGASYCLMWVRMGVDWQRGKEGNAGLGEGTTWERVGRQGEARIRGRKKMDM